MKKKEMVKKISKGATYLSLVTLLSPLVLQSRQVLAEGSKNTTEQTQEQKTTPSSKEGTTEEKETPPSSEEKTTESTKEEVTVGDLDIQLPTLGNTTETLDPETPIVSKDESGNIYRVGQTEDGRIIQSSAITNPLLRGVGNVQGEIIRITIAGVLYEGIKITVDGKGALCVDRDLRAPFEPDVPYDNGSIWSDKGAVSILSHGAYGPLNPNPTDEQIILTEIALYNWKTNKLTPNEAISNTHPYVADLIEKAKQENIVNKVINFSDKSVESTIVGKEQVSKTIKVNGDADNQVSIPVPNGVTLTNITTGQKVTNGTAKVNGGQSFKMSAPLNYKTKYNSGKVQAKYGPYTAVLFTPFSPAYQKLAQGKFADPMPQEGFEVNFFARMGKLKIRKVDETSNKPLPGTTFKITDPSGATIEETTDKNGEIALQDEWVADTVLKVQEIKAPDGYVSHGETKTVTIVGNETTTVTFDNHSQKALFKLGKTGETIVNATAKDSEYGKDYDFVVSDISMAGAVFDVYAKGDKVTGDGTVHVKDGELIGSLTTDENGQAETPKMELGTYTFIEKVAPKGQVLDPTPREITFEYGDQTIEWVEKEETVKNELQKIKIQTHKDEEKFERFEKEKAIFSTVKGENKVFGLFLSQAFTVDGKEIVPRDGLIATATTKNGMADVEEKLPEGAYYVRELYAGENHVLDTTKHEFTLTYDTTGNNPIHTIDIWSNNVLQELHDQEKAKEAKATEGTEPAEGTDSKKPILNKYIRGGVKLTKMDAENGDTIAHVQFDVLNEEKEVIMTRRTNGDGDLLLAKDELPKGKYYLREKHAKIGYILDQTLIPFEIKSNGEIVTLKMDNKRVKQVVKDGKNTKEVVVKTLPSTGEQAGINLTAYGVILLMSAVWFYKKKKEQNDPFQQN